MVRTGWDTFRLALWDLELSPSARSPAVASSAWLRGKQDLASLLRKIDPTITTQRVGRLRWINSDAVVVFEANSLIIRP